MLRWHVGTRVNAAHSEHASPTESSDYFAKQVVVLGGDSNSNSFKLNIICFVFC